MSFFPFLCLLVSIVGTFATDLHTCDALNTVNHPVNLNDSWYWPDGWNQQQISVPQFSAGQNCVWKFNVPKGMYAYFGASFTPSDSTTLLELTDSLGVVTTLKTSDFNHPYFLVDPSFSVQLLSTSVGYLGIQVAWFDIPQTPSTVLNVAPNDAPIALIGDVFNNATTIKSQTRVSLISIKPPQADDDDVPSMRLTLVYDGPTVGSLFLGNLWQVMVSRKQLVSSGQSLTLFSVWPGLNLGNVAILQDYQNVKDFSSYGAINCYLNTKCRFEIDARNGTAAAIRYSQSAHYLTGIEIAQTAQVSVYSGAVNSDTIVARYGYDQRKKSVPQEIGSLLTTYTLDQSVGTFELSGRSDESHWSAISDKRQGVLSSRNIGVSSAEQDFSDSFSGTGTFRISFNASNPGLTGSATLQITVYQDKKTVFDTTYTAQSQPNESNEYVGNQLSVVYKTNGSSTNGCHVAFGFESASASIVGLMSAVIVTVVSLW